MKTFIQNHKITLKNIIFVVVPAAIFPIIDSINSLNPETKWIFVLIATAFILQQVIKYSLKEEKEKNELKNELNIYKKYQISQKILNSLMELDEYKRNLLKTDMLSDYKTEVLLYNPHSYINEICSNIKKLLSAITDINLSSLSVSFIYQYTEFDSKWKWITRKNSTINRDLHEFIIDKNSHSYFNYIITNDISSHFEHDKENLMREGHYWISENDKRFPILGSIASYKMTFIKDEKIRCIGYMVISTYGRNFVENIHDQEQIQDFNYLLSSIIVPSYRCLIEAELGFMYERHKYKNAVEVK